MLLVCLNYQIHPIMIKKILCASVFGFTFSSIIYAQENTPAAKTEPSSATPTFLGMDIIESKPFNEVWIDSGFLSYHWDRDQNLNDNNYGLGGEYRFSSVSAITFGRFYNSDRKYSNYAGVYYQPLKLGPFRLGAVAGGFNGYPNMRNGGWFLAAIPVLSTEWNRFGINLAFVPTLKNRLYGAISLQIKIKVWD